MMLANPRSRFLGLPIVVALAAFLSGIAIYVNIFAALAVVAAVAFMVLLAAPFAALPLIIAASALDRFGPHWGDANVRLDLLAVLLVAAALANRVAVRTAAPGVLQSRLLLPLVAYAGANVFSTLLFAEERVRGLKLDVEIVVAGLTYVLVGALLRTKRDLERAVTALWVVTAGEAAIGLLLALAYLGHATSYGVDNIATGLPAVYGTMWEPNVFGSFLLGNFFVLLADYIGHERRGRYTLALVIILFGIAASLTRTVWLALALGSALFFLRSRKGRGPSSGATFLVFGAVMLALVGLVLGSATPLGARLLDIVNLHSSSAAGRIEWFKEAVSEWTHNPLFGLGTGSWNFGATPGAAHPWLPSLFLLTLHDTGLVGLAALAWLLWRFFAATIPATRGSNDLALLTLGSIVACLCLLLAFQTTTGFWFAYIWIVMAVGTAAARLQRVEE